MRDGFPLPLADAVAPHEPGANARAVPIQPLGALELVAEARRQGDVTDQVPEALRRGLHVYLDGQAGLRVEDIAVKGPCVGVAPVVEPGDLGRRAPGSRLEIRPDRPGYRQQHDGGHTLGDPQDVNDFLLFAENHGGPCRAEAAGPQGETEAPRRLNDGVEQPRSAAAVMLAPDGRDNQGGHPFHVLSQVGA